MSKHSDERVEELKSSRAKLEKEIADTMSAESGFAVGVRVSQKRIAIGLVDKSKESEYHGGVTILKYFDEDELMFEPLGGEGIFALNNVVRTQKILLQSYVLKNYERFVAIYNNHVRSDEIFAEFNYGEL